MLVLSRYVSESIVIGDTVKVMVVDIRGGKVRIGIDAPPHVSIHRQEVHDVIKREHGDIQPRKFAMLERRLYCNLPMPGTSPVAEHPDGFPHYIGLVPPSFGKIIAQALDAEFVDLEDLEQVES